MRKSLAVVAVANSGDVLPAFLDSLAAATTRPYRVIVADNAATDNAATDGASEAAATRAGVELLPLGEDLGYGAAANRAIAELPPDIGWVVVARPQIAWTPSALDVLLEAAARWPRAGAVGPLIRDVDATVHSCVRWRPGPPPRSAEVAPGVERAVGWLDGCCLLLRRAALESVDGFDPDYYDRYADVDLGDRLDRAGWLNVAVPTAEVKFSAALASRPADPHGDSRAAYRYYADRHRGPLDAARRAALQARLRLHAEWVTRWGSRSS